MKSRASSREAQDFLVQGNELTHYSGVDAQTKILKHPSGDGDFFIAIYPMLITMLWTARVLAMALSITGFSVLFGAMTLTLTGAPAGASSAAPWLAAAIFLTSTATYLVLKFQEIKEDYLEAIEGLGFLLRRKTDRQALAE